MESEDETPVERAARIALQELTMVVARRLKAVMPAGVGFTLLLFDFGAKGAFAYASTGDREGCIKMLAEARDKIRGEG